MNQTILNNQLEPRYLDSWGLTQPIALERARAVLESECHVMRFYQVPDDKQALFAAAGEYRQTTVTLAPGSFIVGCKQQTDSSSPSNFLIQITDIETGHKFFNQPYPSQFLFRAGPYMFACPMPVLAPGVLLVEIWAAIAGECSLILCVAELDAEYAITRGCLNAGQ